MTDTTERMLSTHEPPPGGLVQLRARIERDARSRLGVRRLQVATAATVLVALATWAGLVSAGRSDRLPAGFELVQMNLGQRAAPSETLTIPAEHRFHTAVRRVPLPTDHVVFYLIGSIQE